MNYYNEHDPSAAAWLEELISLNLIPQGYVDTRSITEVTPDDLTLFDQCHFFCGIAGWPLALQLAGWPADRQVWTGSCPCQPFSVAGKGLGTADERHLWPVFFELIAKCRPECVFGEQVADAVGKGWLDGVSADLEKEGYACGSAVLGAHSLGAPHIRQRLYWVADPVVRSGQPCESWPVVGSVPDINGKGVSGRMAQSKSIKHDGDRKTGRWRCESPNSSARSGVADRIGPRLEGYPGDVGDGGQPGRIGADPAGSTPESGATGGGMGDTQGDQQQRSRFGGESGRWSEPSGGSGAWDQSSWIPCRDGKHRRVPTQSLLQHVADGFSSRLGTGGTHGFTPHEVEAILKASCGFPLAGKVPHRANILKGAGNAIVPQVAAEFVAAWMDIDIL